MTTAPEREGIGVPADDRLESGLARLLSPGHEHALRLVRRERNWYASSFESELVTLIDGEASRVVFCKHGWEYADATVGRRGVPYESEVYRDLLGAAAPAPEFHGEIRGEWGSTLVLEARHRDRRLTQTSDGIDSAIVRAAAVLGTWHRRARTIRPGMGVNRYGREHLDRWAGRARATGDLNGALTDRVLGRMRDCLEAAEPTLVHGELLPANVLVAADGVRFVDWESTGVGAGELDLAALTLGDWSEGTRHECERVYVQNRWPQHPPPTFHAALAGARLYMLAFVARHAVRRGRPLPAAGVLEQQAAAAAAALA